MNTFIENQFVLKTDKKKPEVVQIINVYEGDMCEVYSEREGEISVDFKNILPLYSPIAEKAGKLTERLKGVEEFITREILKANIMILQRDIDEEYYQKELKQTAQMMKKLDVYIQHIQRSFKDLFEVSHEKTIMEDEPVWYYSFKNGTKERSLVIARYRDLDDIEIKITSRENKYQNESFKHESRLRLDDIEKNKEDIKYEVKQIFQSLYDPSLLLA